VSTPKRKKFNRNQRLEAARLWLQSYAGTKVVRDYRRYFGVDFPTAIKELEILGVSISADYKAAVLKTIAEQAATREQKKAEKLARENPDQDDTFAFIAGYTSGGAPYGITWEEWKQLEPEL
jgi:hypothetical protein